MRELSTGHLYVVLALPTSVILGFLATRISPVLAALAVIMAAFAILFFANLRITLLALLVVRTNIDAFHEMGFVSAGNLDLNAAAILGVALVGMGVFYCLAKRVNVFRSPVAVPYAIFISVALVGIMLTDSPLQGVADWLRMASVIMFYVLMVEAFRSHEDIGKILVAYFLSSAVPGLLGLYQFATDGGVYVDGFMRVYGTFVVPPVFAFYLVALLPVTMVALIHTHHKLIKTVLAFWFLLMFIDLFATYTRGAWIGASIALGVLAISRYRQLLVLLPALALILFLVYPQAGDRLAELHEGESKTGYGEANTLAWRTKFWIETVLATPTDSALVGAGLGTIRRTYYAEPHNDYLRLYIETGVLGFAAYAAVLLLLFARATQAYRMAVSTFHKDLVVAFIAVFLAYVITSVADNIILGPALQWYFWTQAAVVHIVLEHSRGRYRALNDRIWPGDAREAVLETSLVRG